MAWYGNLVWFSFKRQTAMFIFLMYAWYSLFLSMVLFPQTMAENSSPSKLQKVAGEMISTSLAHLLPRDGMMNQSPNQYIVQYKTTLDKSKLIVKGALKQIPTSTDDDDAPKLAYRMYVGLIDTGIQSVMNPLHKEHQRWQFMAHSIGEDGDNGLDIYNDVRVAFPEAMLPCVYSEETEDSW